MITSTMTSKGQITVPKKIRELLGVADSDKLSFTPLEDGKVLLSVEHPSAKILFGMLSHMITSQAKKEKAWALFSFDKNLSKKLPEFVFSDFRKIKAINQNLPRNLQKPTIPV